jgi:hypothetical protein
VAVFGVVVIGFEGDADAAGVEVAASSLFAADETSAADDTSAAGAGVPASVVTTGSWLSSAHARRPTPVDTTQATTQKAVQRTRIDMISPRMEDVAQP